jgi:hypothetical protein
LIFIGLTFKQRPVRPHFKRPVSYLRKIIHDVGPEKKRGVGSRVKLNQLRILKRGLSRNLRQKLHRGFVNFAAPIKKIEPQFVPGNLPLLPRNNYDSNAKE